MLHFDFTKMSIKAVKSELKMLNVNKATGWDGMSGSQDSRVYGQRDRTVTDRTFQQHHS